MSRSKTLAPDPAGATTTDVRQQHHRFTGLYVAAFPGLLGSWVLHIWTGGVHWGPIDTPGSPAATVVAVFILAVLGVGLAWVAWRATEHHERSKAWAQPLFSGTVFAVAAVFTISMGIGPHYWWSGIFLIVCWACATVWSVSTRLNITREQKRDGGSDEGQGKSFKEMLGLDKATRFFTRLVHDEKTGEPIRAHITTHHAGGQTAEVMTEGLSKMESELSAPPGLSTVERDMEHADRSETVLMLKDPFKGYLPLGPLTSPGKSIAEWTSISDYATGKPCLFTVANGIHQPTPTSYALIGMTRSGKTTAENTMLTDWGSRCDWVCLYLNQAKGLQDGRPLLPIVEALIIAAADETGMSAYREAYRQIEESIVPWRTRMLGEFGISAWSPRCGDPDPDRRPSRANRNGGPRLVLPQMPFLTVHTGEADSILAADDRKIKSHALFIASKGLSLGINSGWSLQSPDWESMPTKLRGNIGLWFIHGLGNSEQTDMVVENHKIRSQITPEYWKSKRPGQHYMIGVGADEAMETTPLKSRFLVGSEFDADGNKLSYDEMSDRWSNELLRRNLESAPRMARLEDGAVEATGGWWEAQRAKADELRYKMLELDGPQSATESATSPQSPHAESARESATESVRESVRVSGPHPHAESTSAADDEDAEFDAFRAEHRAEVRKIEQEGIDGVSLYDDDEDPGLAEDLRKHDLSGGPQPSPQRVAFDPLADGGYDGRPEVHDRQEAIRILDGILGLLLVEKADPRVPGTALIQVNDVLEASPSNPFRQRPWISGELARLTSGSGGELAESWNADREGPVRKGRIRISRKGRTDHSE